MAPSRALTRRLALRRPPSPPTTTALPRRAHYHSYDRPPPPGPFNTTEQSILAAAYRRVPEHGFTQQALALGARDIGYPDISTNLFPNGPFSLIRYHLVTQREALAPRRDAIFASSTTTANPPPPPPPPPPPTNVADRVERLTWERLLGNQEVNHQWQGALAIMAQPSHVPASLRELALLADEIHFLAGDSSVDPSWYTKRGGLSVVYASSELFMTNDRSPGFGETRAFLQRRLAEGVGLSSVVGNVGQWLGFTASAGVNVLRSKGVRI